MSLLDLLREELGVTSRQGRVRPRGLVRGVHGARERQGRRLVRAEGDARGRPRRRHAGRASRRRNATGGPTASS